MSYLTSDEISQYCNIIDGTNESDVEIASALIDGYLGRSYQPKEFADRVRLRKDYRGSLTHSPVIEIIRVESVTRTQFGQSVEPLKPEDILLDVENDGYFSYVGGFGFQNMFFGSSPDYINICYTSGFTVYPERLKQATAMLAQNIRQSQSFAGAKQLTSLDFQIQMTDDSFFTSDIRMMLKGLRADV